MGPWRIEHWAQDVCALLVDESEQASWCSRSFVRMHADIVVASTCGFISGPERALGSVASV